MKFLLELRDNDCVYGDQSSAWIEMVVQTGCAETPFQADVHLLLGEKEYEVAPGELVVLGKAMEAYLEQRRAVEVVEARCRPQMQQPRLRGFNCD